ncbi:hypothetical protein [uncultured Ruegeria sp.]|uniref:hypothetical protein n=1 Tax=uncultured Ruegeria sp. TaxID=259304 RepID=UPI0026109258|nr:hypothetical protein [uncultured Ruegeria sp.]
MAYNATVLSVMIASPGDVTEERNLIRDVIHEWNDINSKATQCVLLPVGWETHSAPDLAGRAQDIINKDVLEHCDFLVGVFWTRLGTPTGDFESGTVEEIKRHVSGSKPAMVYFSTAPVAPESLEPEQYQALKTFKDWCFGQGLVETYDNISDFSDKFRRHIQMKVRDHPLLSKNLSEKSVSTEGNYISTGEGTPIVGRLSEEAVRLLLEASKDRNGTISHLRYLGGQAIQTNGINFADSKDRRSVARWEAALEQLQLEALVKALSAKREIFEMTAKGYELADKLTQS